MKKWMKALTLLCVTMVSCMALAIPAFASRPYENAVMNCELVDPEGVFDEADTGLLNDRIRETSRNIDMYVAVVIRGTDAPDYSDEQVMVLADDEYDKRFNVQYGEETDGALLYLNLSTHYAYISTCGMGQLYYFNGSADDRIDAIISKMRDYLRNDNYIEAIGSFCSSLEYYYNAGIPDGAYSYDEYEHKYYYQSGGKLVSSDRLPLTFRVNWTPLLIVAGCFGTVSAIVVYLVIASKYKLVKTLDATNYISQQDTNFYVHDDLFLREHTTKVHIDSESRSGGGGGGGSSHMSSGGFSHGGGGGHW